MDPLKQLQEQFAKLAAAFRIHTDVAKRHGHVFTEDEQRTIDEITRTDQDAGQS